MMGIISLCTLFCPEFAYYIPLFIIGFAQIRYFTLKSLLGAFIGFATPPQTQAVIDTVERVLAAKEAEAALKTTAE